MPRRDGGHDDRIHADMRGAWQSSATHVEALEEFELQQSMESA